MNKEMQFAMLMLVVAGLILLVSLGFNVLVILALFKAGHRVIGTIYVITIVAGYISRFNKKELN